MFIMWYLDVNKRRHKEQEWGWDISGPGSVQISGKTIATWIWTAGWHDTRKGGSSKSKFQFSPA